MMTLRSIWGATLSCGVVFFLQTDVSLIAQDQVSQAQPDAESSEVPKGLLEEGQTLKTIQDQLEPGDLIKICSQFVRWELDQNQNGRMDFEEVSKYSHKTEEFATLNEKEYAAVVDWAYKDLDHRNAATLYKQVGERRLHMLISFPKGWKKTDQRPVALFFFGGGFNQGNYFGGKHRAKYYNSLGIVYALVDYRVHLRDGKDTDSRVAKFSRAFDDCKDAVRWVRAHAAEYGIDPQKLICCGSSAGTMVKELHRQEDPKLRPNALVLQVPYRGGGNLDDIRKNTDDMTTSIPPTICFAAGKDRISHPFAKQFAEAIVEGGGIAETVVYEDESHVLSSKVYSDMHQKTKDFLLRIGLVD